MEEEHMLTGHTRAVLALVVDEPSSRLYSSSADATVRAWDLADMSCVAVIRSHSKPVTKLQLLGGRLLFTAAGGGVRVWDTRTFVCLAKVKTSFYSGAIRSMLVRVWCCLGGGLVGWLAGELSSAAPTPVQPTVTAAAHNTQHAGHV
jgi:WD40 repeat protein